MFRESSLIKNYALYQALNDSQYVLIQVFNIYRQPNIPWHHDVLNIFQHDFLLFAPAVVVIVFFIEEALG
jgi:hypothetical protein